MDSENDLIRIRISIRIGIGNVSNVQGGSFADSSACGDGEIERIGWTVGLDRLRDDGSVGGKC